MEQIEATQQMPGEFICRWSLIGASVLLLALSGCRNRLPTPEVGKASHTESGVGVVVGKVARGGVGARGIAVWLQPRGKRTPTGVAEALMARLLGRYEARTDAAGSFRIANVPTGPCDLVIRWGIYELHRPGLQVIAGEVTPAHVALGTGRIALQVVDARGAPVPGASLKAFPAAEGGGFLVVHEVTDPSGRARIELLSEGLWQVDARFGAGVDGSARDLRVVEGATTQAVLRVAPYGVASIRVVDAARNPLAGRLVRMEQVSGPFLYVRPTDALGVVAVPAAVGRWRVEVQGTSQEGQIVVLDGRRAELQIIAGAGGG